MPESKPLPLRAALREATTSQHRAVDASLSQLDLADPRDYTRFLRVQLLALSTLSRAWGLADRTDLESLIGCLRADLGDPLPSAAAVVEITACRTPFVAAGVAYVVRGSRLGATILARRVAPRSPMSYLTHRLTLAWPAFLAQLADLDAVAQPGSIDDSVAAARSAFGVFACAARAAALDPTRRVGYA